jgi:glycerol-3-phosphate dehydrogenase
MSFGPRDRDAMVARLEAETFDLLVVGGGITGAGIFRDAALRGLKVGLVEMDDFASGTSSRSSKLVHGGLRYLENYQFGLVHESTTERTKLERLAAHLVRPLPFLMPVWKDSKHGLEFMNLGLWLYDALSLFGVYRIHSRLGRKELIKAAPMVRQEGLTGGLLYYDAVTDDTRLTVENILGGRLAGGAVLSRARAEGAEFRDGRVASVTVRDLVTGRTLAVRAKSVIAAAGPWTESAQAALGVVNGPRLRPTKGTHVIVPFDKAPFATAVVMVTPQDGRAAFIIPWHGATVIGTTDTDYEGDPANVFASREDVDYLLAAARYHFPGMTATAGDVIGTWAGLRPLLRSEGVSESKVSREHFIHVDPRGIVTIAGGKLTTYRLMAKECLEALAPFLDAALPKPITGHTPLPYRGDLSDVAAREAAIARLQSERGSIERPEATPAPARDCCAIRSPAPACSGGVPEDIARHLVNTYGAKAEALLELAVATPALAERLDPRWPYTGVEIAWAAREEMALTLIDALCRRTLVFYLLGDGLEPAARKAAAIMSVELGWDAARIQAEVDGILRYQDRHLACVR